MRRITVETEDDLVITITFEGPLTTAEIDDLENGLYSTGHAKHHPDDVYSLEFGQKLAVARAAYRYYRKIEKRLVRTTK
jgi:hypothetical protein